MQSYEFYEETRKYPRIKLKLPVQLTLDGGRTVSASIYDISPDGLQIRSSRDIAAKINPAGKKIDPRDNMMIKASFSLPIDNQLKDINVFCNVYYFVIVTDEKEEDIAFGLRFKKFEGQSIKHIGRHILYELEQAEKVTDSNLDNLAQD